VKNKIKVTHLDVDVPYHDLDGMNIVWHGHYYKYFEYARTAFLRSIGFDMPQMIRSGYMWPVIESHCRYISPMRYGMRVHIKVAIADAQHRVKFTYAIYDKKGGRRLAYGHTVQAAVDAKTGELCLMTPKAFLKHLK
jgi:acyl-CoA thioester hydrolase